MIDEKDKLWRIQDVADFYGVHVNTIRRWRNQNMVPMPVIKTRGTVRWNPDDFLQPSATTGNHFHNPARNRAAQAGASRITK